MSRKLPLEINRNFTVKDRDDAWELTCIVCKTRFSLNKPKKGDKVDAEAIKLLLEHASSHPIPQEEETPTPVKKPALVQLPKESQPPTNFHMEVQQPLRLSKYSSPSDRNPNPYKVNVKSTTTTVTHFRDPAYTKFGLVEQNAGTYIVVLYAANSKHASLIGKRLIEAYISEKRG